MPTTQKLINNQKQEEDEVTRQHHRLQFHLTWYKSKFLDWSRDYLQLGHIQQSSSSVDEEETTAVEIHNSIPTTDLQAEVVVAQHHSPLLGEEAAAMTTTTSSSEMDLAEALQLVPFASLAVNTASVDHTSTRRVDGGVPVADDVDKQYQGPVIICAPPASTFTSRSGSTPPKGIAFRARRGTGHGHGLVIEAVRLSLPILEGGGTINDNGDQDNGEGMLVLPPSGGRMNVVGSFVLEFGVGTETAVARLACSDDARLLLAAFTNGTLSCLNVLIGSDGGNGDGVGELAVGFTYRWKMMTTAAAAAVAAKEEVWFPTLEFLHVDGNRMHYFLAVVESLTTTTTSDVLFMDAASSSTEELTPPLMNLWSLTGVDVADGVISCATARPTLEGGERASSSSEAPTMIAFGTTKGSLGVLSISLCGGTVVSVRRLSDTEYEYDSRRRGPMEGHSFELVR